MVQRLIALYNSFEAASRAVEELVENGFSRENISLIANDSDSRYAQYLARFQNQGTGTTTSAVDDDDVSGGEGAGFGAIVGGLIGLGAALIPGIGPVVAAGPLAAAVMAGVGAVGGAVTGGVAASLINFGVDEDDANRYAESIRRGGTLLVIDATDQDSDRVEDILDRHDPVDVEEFSADTNVTTSTTTTNLDARPSSTFGGSTVASDTGTTGTSSTRQTLDAGEQERIDIVEENLEVGKRTVEDGGVRVRTYQVERPVNEQVTLRDERVVVERHPVDRPATESDLNAFTDRTIEVTERHEEPVVNKTARVVEEVVIGKQATEHVETVQDTVRRTEVEVEPQGSTVETTGTSYTSGTGATNSAASMGGNGYESYMTRFRTNYDTNYANSGYGWEYYDPAYRYGYTLANTDRYRTYTWSQVEPEARRAWEAQNQGTWERFKDAVRHAWMEITNRA